MKIRVWKLGSIEHNILPNAAAIDKFKNTLQETINNGGGDIIWGPDISVEMFELDQDVKNYILKDGKLELVEKSSES